MGYAKERGKLEKVLAKIIWIKVYDEKNLAIILDSHEQFSHTIRILKNKEPEIFTDLYNTELQEVKDGRKLFKESEGEETRLTNFLAYKDIIVKALEKTIKVSNETV
jgi:hypothetical protein